MTKLIVIIAKIYARWIDKQRTHKLRKKYMKLLNNELTEDEIKYEELIEINLDLVDELFNIHITKEELIKLDIYKRIYILIRNGCIDKNDYSIYMRITKNLPSQALAIIPKIYVYIQNKNKTRMPLADYLNSIQKNNHYLCKTLINEALLDIEPCVEGNNIIHTNLLPKFTELFFSKEDLTLKAQNIKKWDCSIHIMNNGEFNGEEEKIKNLLEKKDIRGYIALTYAANLENSFVLNLIILIKNIDIDPLLLNQLNKIPKRINIIKLTLHKNVIDPIPNIGNNLIYLNLNDEKSKETFLNSFIIRD